MGIDIDTALGRGHEPPWSARICELAGVSVDDVRAWERADEEMARDATRLAWSRGARSRGPARPVGTSDLDAVEARLGPAKTALLRAVARTGGNGWSYADDALRAEIREAIRAAAEAVLATRP